jgi:hypothetical protein
VTSTQTIAGPVGQRGRKRRWLGAAAVVAGCVLAVVFVGSRWKRLEVRWTLGPSQRVVVGGGTIGYYRLGFVEPPGVELDDSPQPQWHLWYWWWETAPKGWTPMSLQCGGPLWPAVVVMLAGGFGLVRWGRRAGRLAGVCARCGYDVRGLSVCPECGASAGAVTKK